MSDEYNVKSYTEEELLTILNLNDPSDRELEAHILTMIRKYNTLGSESGDKLAKFFTDVYDYFFDVEGTNDEGTNDEGTTDEGTNIVEGMTVSFPKNYDLDKVNTVASKDADPKYLNTQNVANAPKQKSNPDGKETLPNEKKNMGYKRPSDVQLTKPLDYSKDYLNPLLKQTVKRIISIDSQYRDNSTTTPSTNFTFNLSEPLKDVVSLSLYSIQIPFTWYTINSDYGGNVFIFKGNSPGIDNGDHDYTVSTKTGGYTKNVELTNDVNKGIDELKNSTSIVDVSFGETTLVYNKGDLNSQSGTSKVELYADIKKVFNEGNFYLDFSNNWSSPTPTTDETNANRCSTIGGYLGFNNKYQPCSSIYSNYFPILSNAIFTVAKNGTFTIVPYIGDNYKTATEANKFPEITITIPDGNYTKTGLISTLDTILKTDANLDENYTFCRWIDVSGQDSNGVPLYRNGSYYIQIACKLKAKKSQIVSGLKIAAIFPASATSIFYDADPTKQTSCFSLYIPSSDVITTSGLICEFNTLYSDIAILESSYAVNGTNQIRFECVSPGYINPLNNYSIDISDNDNYTLQEYITAIQTGISSYKTEHVSANKSISGTEFISSSNGYLSLQTQIKTIFTNEDYRIKATGKIVSLFDISANLTNISGVYNGTNYQLTNTTFSALNDTIVISPKSGLGNSGADNFVIGFNGVFANASALQIYLETQIKNFTDPSNNKRKPFLKSTVSYSRATKYTLNLVMELQLTQDDYKLLFYSDQAVNTWSKLSFDTSYNLNTTVEPVVVREDNGFYTTVRNKTPETDNQIAIITNQNDTFYLKPYSNINGLQTPNNLYQIQITIVPGNYSMIQLLTAINTNLAANELSKGTKLELTTINGSVFVSIRFNINKVFSTKDYRVVFYDPFSFVKCYSGASRKGSDSVQNATMDSTLGWILGFRQSMEYNLKDYLVDNSNLCILEGDTSVSINIYNYFLIMLDDYVQNHLNDGLITITSQDTTLSHEPFKRICDPAGGEDTQIVPMNYGDPGVSYSQAQLYAFAQRVKSDVARKKSYSSGPFVRDIFGIIPVKTAGLTTGSSYVEFGGTLQNQQRLYFGPVNIHRMTIKLLNDRGSLVDLNKQNWSFSLVCEQLYKNGYS